ncbi:MAG: hypothetical protein ACOX6U_11365 [Oscillospiraceae bacterium]|jgi:hypothetical protein
MCKSVQFELSPCKVEADGVSFITFGITCGTAVFKDISDNRESVLGLVKLLNHFQPEPGHLESIIEDFLNRPSLKGDRYFPLETGGIESF